MSAACGWRRRSGASSWWCRRETLRALAEEALTTSTITAAGPSAAAALHPRRPGGERQRQVRRLRLSEKRQHRRRRHAADVPGHRHRHHHGQEGPPRLHRRRATRRRSPRARATPISKRNLRYSQLAPISMFEEKNTSSNMPAQVEIYAEGEDDYKFLFIAKGGGSANKSFLFQATPSILTHDRLHRFPEGEGAHARHRGLSALSPRHRHRRHLGRADHEDGEARLLPLSRRPADARARRTATPSATSRWSRRSTR